MSTPHTENVFDAALGSNPSIYIPYLFPTMTKRKLKAIFKELDLFTISAIDFNVKTKPGNEYYFNAFVHVATWNVTPTATTVRAKLIKNSEIKIVYDKPLFFICKRKHEPHELESFSSPIAPKCINPNYISSAPTNIKGVTRTPSPQEMNHSP